MSDIDFISNPNYVPYKEVAADYAHLTARFIELGVFRFYLHTQEQSIRQNEADLSQTNANMFLVRILDDFAARKRAILSNPEAGLAFGCIKFGHSPVMLDNREFTKADIEAHMTFVAGLEKDEFTKNIIEEVSLRMYNPADGRTIMGSNIAVGRYKDADKLQLNDDIHEPMKTTLQVLFEEQSQLAWWPN